MPNKTTVNELRPDRSRILFCYNFLDKKDFR